MAWTKEEILARRARREERRAKQREQSVLRAAKMHAARIAFEQDAAPVETPLSPPGGIATSFGAQAFVGCSGWYYWHWKYCFYPEGSKSDCWFRHYAKHFRTVELNAPFYSWPTVGTVQSWLRQAAGLKNFVYTVKVCEMITHTKRFARTATLVRDFGYIADLLGSRMGCFLFQLPPSFHYTPARLTSILKQLDPRRRNVVEFRHKTWWNDKVYKPFEKAGVTFCSCSGPRLPDELIKTADDIYVRFHGTTKWYRHDYTKEELAVWAQRIRESGAKRVWAYFNNDREGFAIKNAKELLRQLKKRFATEDTESTEVQLTI